MSAATHFTRGRHVLLDAGGAVVVAAASGANTDRLERLVAVSGGSAVLGLAPELAHRLGLAATGAASGPLPGTPGPTVDAAQDRGAIRGAIDRGRTMRVAADPGTRPGDLVSPGRGPTLILDDPRADALLELARRSGSAPALALAAVTDADGSGMSLRAARQDPRLRRLPVWARSEPLELVA